MANKKVVDLDKLEEIINSITISGADSILDFNDGVEFCRDLVLSLATYEECCEKYIEHKDINITQEVIETIKRGELND